MDDRNGKNPYLAISVALALIATLGVIVATQVPFKGERPSVPAVHERSEKVRARLWQDPFQAVLDHVKEREESGKQIPDDQDDIVAGVISFSKCKKMDETLKKKLTKRPEGAEVTVLAVMVFGGPYAELRESRIRYRYAVLSGLEESGYYPEDSEHIGCIKVSNKKDDKEFTLLNIMPFEWLVSNEQKKFVMIIWLNEDIFEKIPLENLICLKSLFQSINKNLIFKVIGPPSSTTFFEMIAENIINKTEIPEGMNIFSATATADYDELIIKLVNKNRKELENKVGSAIPPDVKLVKQLRMEFEDKTKDNLERTICSDYELATALSKELDKRGVGQGDSIVLLSEWDTDYGRLLPVTFEKAFRETNLGVKVHRYSYLRGIDGKIPGEQERDDTKRPKNDADRKEKEDLQKLEEPLGKSQFDYLRRLAERISYLEENHGPISIKAIGVLGSDFYDKYLVLQALGQQFPDRIFFTNDLDARYLHPANIEWTRNLVVASSFGLQLQNDVQGKIPPFRGVYQTSMFAATLRAFDRLGKTDFKDLKPRIFEIGRYNAIDLTERSAHCPRINQVPVPAWQSPDLTKRIIIIRLIICFIVFLSIILWLLVLPSSTIRQVIIGVIVLLAILIPICIYSHIQSEEPFSLTEGISIWPTLIFRIIGIILSWVFFFYSIISLRKNCDTIANEFKLKKCSERKDQHTKSNIIMLRKIDYGDKINSLWQEYIRRGLILHRFKRTIFIVLIYIIITIFIVGIGGLPLNPVRGKGTSELYKYLLLINVISFYILTFFVFDAIRLFRWFVTCLQEKEMEWNETSLRQFGWKADMSKEALKDRMLIRLIAKRTEAVGTLIYYPFIIWFIMFVARLHYFDNYHTPIGLAIVIFISPVFAWFCAVMLRRSAESLRAQVIDRLEKHLISVRSTELWEEKKSGKETSEYIQWVIDETKANRQGAFAPFLQQPALQSLLVPFASIGGANLLDLLK